MDTIIKPQASALGMMRSALRANGIFSSISGTLLIVLAEPVSILIGIQPSVVLVIIGLAVLAFAGLLLWATSRPEIDRRLTVTTVILDTAWVVASVTILLSGQPPLTTAGKWLIAILAIIVADFAVWQSIGLKRQS
jgi:hypothetical protein